MSSPSSAADQRADEVVPLQSVQSTGHQSSGGDDSPKSQIKDYRQLAIGSIICGISCIGILALISSVKRASPLSTLGFNMVVWWFP
ncbi:hypothetical protein MATL_G00215700 [Megalops atlanticus]|uniref:Uncharacterized protein n=1 Tax=Megalops atlanticus TaxID=7932 RepID=A0A9D3PLB3_MEGAT|nr:hypothetical protein MATL_G00215700 [Megalops atlanticus]